MSLITPDFGLLFWMTLIFGIVFFLLAKFGFPMITGSVEKRSERINASIAKAREAEEKLHSLADSQEKMLKQAQLEQARILKETSEARDQMIAQAKEDAREEARKILEHARMEIAAEKESAMRDLRRQVSLLSVEVAEKIVRKNLKDSSEQMELIDKLVDEVAGMQDRS
ncbi:MAG: F0F1 ATP synthase subunit B [Bacteroidales bacterium]|nr:F0F1 ATP synthase subunit B [Bacteroidales bacterium]